MGKQTIFMHLGLAKTGSTAIQTFLARNTDRLKEHGLVMLDANMRLYKSWYTAVMRDEVVVPVEEQWLAARKRMREAGCNGLHSNEAFSIVCEQRPDFVKDVIEFLPEYALKLVVYIRRQDRHYESSYLQDVEYYGAPQPFDPAPPPGHLIMSNGLSTDLYDYHGWLTEMQSHLREEDKLIVRVYDRDVFVGGSIYRDFIDALGMDWDDEFVIPTREANPSIDGRYAEICRKSAAFFRANTVLKSGSFEEAPFENVIFYRMMQSVNAALRRTGNKNLFNYEDRKTFLARYAECNRRVAEDFLGTSAPLFDESDLATAEGNEPDAFEDGELEMALILLHRIWLETASLEKVKTMNYLRLRHYRRLKKKDPDDPAAKRGLFRHKMIHSLGKRLFKNWGGVPQMEAALWSMAERNAPKEQLLAELEAFRNFESKQ